MQTNANQPNKCTLCATPITDANDSQEHIIPNAIGGWKTVSGFVCNSCNNSKGHWWDATLAKQFGWLSLMAGVERDRGELQPVPVTTVSGKEYLLYPNGSFEPRRFQYSQRVDGEKVIVSFVARTPQEAHKKIAELKKKYPKLDAEGALKAATMTSRPLDEPLLISMPEGGPDVGRSVVSTALAYAKHIGINPEQCEVALHFLRVQNCPPTCYGWSFLEDVIPNRPSETLFHCVSIFGDPRSGKLFAYVEYFSYARWHIELSRQYVGPEIYSTYAIDPSCTKEICLDVDWDKSVQSIGRVVDGDGYDAAKVEEALAFVMPILLGRAHRRTITSVGKAALEEGWNSLNLN
jgi:hypothetical protein